MDDTFEGPAVSLGTQPENWQDSWYQSLCVDGGPPGLQEGTDEDQVRVGLVEERELSMVLAHKRVDV